MPDSSFDLSELLKNITPEQLAELGKRINEAGKTVSEKERSPVKVALQIEIDDATDVDPAEFYAALSKAAGGQPLPITLEEMRALQNKQSELVRWIMASNENAALFAADPVLALRQSSVHIDELLLTKLESLNKGLPGFGSFAGVSIEKVTLKAKQAAQQPKQE